MKNITANKSENIGTFTIGGLTYEVYIAKTEKLKAKGLQGFVSLPKSEGMLFINDEPEDVWYHMKNVGTDLDLVFLDDEMKVISVKKGIANDETPIKERAVTYVLEVNAGSNIKEGDEGDLDDDDTDYVMEMLAPNGNIQFEMEGGERIFSRISTKKMIRKAIKAESTKSDSDYKALGKIIFKELQALDNREPEYVE